MNREILFRGKEPCTGGWYFGDLDTAENCPEIWSKKYGTWVPVRAETVGQYTGLKDKNGEKIFEGDILSDRLDDETPEEANYAVIEWQHCGWVLVVKGEFFDSVVEADDGAWTVVGNIYDNPELVEDTP